MDTSDLTALTDRARTLAAGGGRRILGIAGARTAGRGVVP
ncbi:nucleoside/nucleotide kinase family protein, partial [[Kitasatospora] papulosa]